MEIKKYNELINYSQEEDYEDEDDYDLTIIGVGGYKNHWDGSIYILENINEGGHPVLLNDWEWIGAYNYGELTKKEIDRYIYSNKVSIYVFNKDTHNFERKYWKENVVNTNYTILSDSEIQEYIYTNKKKITYFDQNLRRYKHEYFNDLPKEIRNQL